MNLSQYIGVLKNDPGFMANVTCWKELPARPARYLPFPDSLDARAVTALGKKGITQLYSHQRQAIDAALRGEDVVVVTPTASGKTLCYNLPVLQRILAEPEARALYERHGAAAMFHRVGRPVESLVFPELIRLKRLHPDLYEKTWKFLMPHDYLICRLSGAAVTDYSMASGSMCYDVARHAWASDLLEEYGIDERKLPELRDAGTRAGTVTPETAALLGISPDAVVTRRSRPSARASAPAASPCPSAPPAPLRP